MPTFVDEGGSTGLGPGSHGYFRVAAVWLPPPAIGRLERGVVRLRHELGLRSGHPFKFHKTERYPVTRERIFRLGMDAGMRFAACHVRVFGAAWQGTHRQQHIHWFTTTGVATALRPVYEAERRRAGEDFRERVVVDRCDDGRYLEELAHAFRGMRSAPNTEEPLTRLPTFEPDERHDGLQLVDMVCGAVGSHIEAVEGKAAGSSRWFRLIEECGLGGDERFGRGVCVK